MKHFTNKWKASKRPGKQRKFRANANFVLKRKMISSTLSEDLRKKYGKRSFALRKGDKVKVLRGESAGKEGKIESVNLDKMKVTIEALQIQKKDGSKVPLFFDSSNLRIIELVLDDKMRLDSMNRKTSQTKPAEKKEATK